MTTMISNARYRLSPAETPGCCHVDSLTQESADVASRVLQANRNAHHVFTSDEAKMGAYLHNHIVHHTLALWALGADAETIEQHARFNTSYQLLPRKFVDLHFVEELGTPDGYCRLLGDQDYFLDFVEFFDREIAKHGYQAVLQKYMLDGGPIADDLLARMYMGYVHSFMYVGMALEFKQMPLLAEGLAQAAVHHDMYYTDFLRVAEVYAQLGEESALPLSDCVDACLQDPVITSCSTVEVHYQFDPEQGKWKVEEEMIRDYVCKKAFHELARVCARYRVDPDNVEKATAELINTMIWIAAGAQFPPYECRYDFFLIHGTNASIWHTSFLEEPSISNKQKARLLEYTGRVMLMLYAGMGCPPPRMNWILSHTPREPESTWSRVIERGLHHADDGHMIKLIRAIYHAEAVSRPYEGEPGFRLKQSDFLPCAIAAIDSASEVPMIGIQHFDLVRGAAWPKAWAKVPIRKEETQS